MGNNTPYELIFKVLVQGLDSLKGVKDGAADTSKTMQAIAEPAAQAAAGMEKAAAATVAHAEANTAAAGAIHTVTTAQEAEAVELARLTELLGSEDRARASLNSRIIDMTAVEARSEEQLAASAANRAQIMEDARQRAEARATAQREAATVVAASAEQEVAAAVAVREVEQVALNDAAQLAVLRVAAADATRSLASAVEDLRLTQQNLVEAEAREQDGSKVLADLRLQLASDTARVAEAEKIATDAKRAHAEIDDRLTAAEKRAAVAAKELAAEQKAGTFAGRTKELGDLLGVLGLFSPKLFGASYGLQMAGQASESFGARIVAAGGGVAGFTAVLGPLAAIAATATVVLLAVGEAVHLVTDAFAAGIVGARAETDLTVLLGTSTAARERLEELDATARRFNLPVASVRAASLELGRFTQGALGAGNGLDIVIEAAARSGKSMTAAAQIFGRAYESIMAGEPIQRATAQLERSKLISASTANELRNLSKEGKSGSEVWAALEAAVKRYGGAAEAQAHDFQGEVQGIRTAWDQTLEAFGKPVVDATTPIIRALGGLVSTLVPKAQSAGQAIGNAINTINGLIQGGQLEEELGDAIALGAARGVRSLLGQFQDAWNQVTELFSHPLKVIAEIDQRLYGGALDFIKNNTGSTSTGIDPSRLVMQNGKLVVAPKPSAAPVYTNTGTEADEFGGASITAGVDNYINEVQARMDKREEEARLRAAKPETKIEQPPYETILPDPKPAKAGRSAVGARKKEVDEGAEAEKTYRSSLDQTKEALALGEISSAQAAEQNTQTIQAYIKRLTDLQRSGKLTADQMTETAVRIKDAQQLLAQQSVLGNIRYQLRQVANEWTDMAKQAGNAAKSIATNLTSSLGTVLTDLAFRTGNLKQDFVDAGKSIIGTLAQIVIQYTVGRALMAAINAATGQTEGAVANAQASSAAAAWAPAATSASIATYGTASGAGLAAYLGALGAGSAAATSLSASGFRGGDYTGDGPEHEVAGPAHRGEFYFTARQTRALGLPYLRSLAQMRLPSATIRSAGGAGAGESGGSGGGWSPTGGATGPRRGRGNGANPPVVIQVHSHPDTAAMNRHIAEDPDAHHIIAGKITGMFTTYGFNT